MRIYLIVLTIILPLKVFSTGQVADAIIYNGDTLQLLANPLELLYDSTNRPEWFFERSSCMSTACWRGYIAYWEIKDNNLFLIKIGSCCPDKDFITADLARLFGDKFVNGKVHAYWVTGELFAPFGKMLFYEHSGYERIYEQEFGFTINNGKLIKVNSHDNRKTIVPKYYSDQKTFYEFMDQNLNWNIFKGLSKGSRIFIELTSGNGGGPGEAKIVRGLGEPYDSEVIRTVKKLPEWLTLYRHGVLYRRSVILPVFVGKEAAKKYRGKL
jgi:hypothetical protein